MQTFLPYADFYLTAAVLDNKRLGKQRVEAYQILNILEGKSKGNAWKKHPAVLMWYGYENALKEYFNVISSEWVSRGYKHNMGFHILGTHEIVKPHWLGAVRFHVSHQSNLLRKLPEHYGKFFLVAPTLPYYWPSSRYEYEQQIS